MGFSNKYNQGPLKPGTLIVVKWSSDQNTPTGNILMVLRHINPAVMDVLVLNTHKRYRLTPYNFDSNLTGWQDDYDIIYSAGRGTEKDWNLVSYIE